MESWSEYFQRFIKSKVGSVSNKYKTASTDETDGIEKKDISGKENNRNAVNVNNNAQPAKKKKRSSSKKKFLDLSPENLDIADYCKSLLHSRFHGEVEYEDGRPLPQIVPPTMDLSITLADALRGLDEVVRSVDDDFNGFEEEFMYYIHACEYLRSRSLNEQRKETLLEQSRRFIKVYKRRGGISQELAHDDFWATRQQLMAGKVIADWVDPACGPMDPIFGVLLNPTAGRTGPGDSSFVHRLFFDHDGPMAYHSAVHDGFGYLITSHTIGPGYDYLGAWSLFDSETPLSGQLSGISFWKTLLKETEDIKIDSVVF